MTHGIRFTRADGSVALELDETFAGLIHSEAVAQDFTGTFSVPDFDSTRGMFYVQFELSPRAYGVGVPRPEQPVIGAAFLPSLSWSNSTKTMTVSPADIPAGWSFATRPDYSVIFIHYR